MSPTSYDAIIVGARAAGATTAFLLARRGYRVLLVDRAKLPGDVPHGHLIHKEGPRRLRAWGLLDAILAAGTPPVDTVTTYFGDFPLAHRNLVHDGLAWGYGPRRRVVDEILLKAAIAAGAEFRDGFSVEELTFDDEGVTGIRGRSGDMALTERATITIGADGRRSRVAHAVGAALDADHPTLLCYYFSYWSGVPSEGMEIYHANNRVSFAHPTNDGLFGAFTAWPIAHFDEVRTDVERQFMTVVDGCLTLGERLRAGRREERFYGTGDLPNFRRKPFGDGWALVGDAGYHKDPYLALGMSDAFRDADFLAEAVDDGLSGRVPMATAMAGYERRRNEASHVDFEENLVFARLQQPPPQVLAMRAALRGNPEQTTRFWLARVGLIPREEFFSPENLAQLLASAPARA